LSTNFTETDPDDCASARLGTGFPEVVTVKELAFPSVNTALFALVIAGAEEVELVEGASLAPPPPEPQATKNSPTIATNAIIARYRVLQAVLCIYNSPSDRQIDLPST
jgi:hypothetical protein